MAITQPTIDDFQDTTVMRVIRKVVNYLVALVPKVNEEIDNLNELNQEALAQQNTKITAIETNVEALNKELPSEIRVEYDPSTGNFNIDYVKEDGDVLTSNTVVIVSGSTGEVTIVQNTSGISVNGIALQSATTAQPGLMTPALVSSLNNVNDTTNDHTTMLNAQAEAITALDDRVDALEQGGSGGGEVWEEVDLANFPSNWVEGDKIKIEFYSFSLTERNVGGNKYYSFIITSNGDCVIREFRLPSSVAYPHYALGSCSFSTANILAVIEMNTIGSPTEFNTSGTMFKIIISYHLDGTDVYTTPFTVDRSNLSTYIYKMWRLKK